MRNWRQADWCDAAPVTTGRRQRRGARAYLAGQAAEDRVQQDYERRGYRLAARRWRGRSGEVDLIFRGSAAVIFVEVKCARDFDRALDSLGARQIARICAAAEEFVGREPMGSLTDIRFDIGLVDGTGAVRVMENALAA
ncbi:YraN family protein [Pseudooceanicola sp. LIPI14-2-Ac024]|uniref:YraN family protein n=1 Tax=Pseudooceanicola sp. LIPI14-2-Ac024 TaxID=3344875 RepID=UPI0035CFF014